MGAVTLAAVLFVAFGCGGYVAGRMARFDGARQGLAVWLWAVVLAVVVAGLGLGAGDRVDLPAGLDPGSILPVRWGDLSTAGLLACCRDRGGQPLRGDPRRTRRDALPPTGRRAALTRPPHDDDEERTTMKIDRQEIVELLRSIGEDDTADHAERELPEEVDTDDHRAELDQLGINPTDLLGGIGGTFG